MTATASEGLFVVTDDTTRFELETAICHLNDIAKRLPIHFVDRRADLHRRMNVLLCEWQMRA
ncbi:hypothetical protein [Nocardioides terrigena]|uniref:hypothetical protein n=1 Tax=Nocardioides terrigena TaxID=424797 RepID=UPI000D31A5A0|nr:hypothetical protein [Nocardioides terrigena]